MLVLPLIDIKIPASRQRKTLNEKDLKELALSIEKNGNLQQPGIFMDAGTPTLVWGERRFRAITLLADSGKQYRLPDGTIIPLGSIAVQELNALLHVERLEAEFDENVQRVELPWPDRVRALAEIHNLRKATNPKQTIIDTAMELSARTGVSISTLSQSPSTSHPTSPNSIPIALALAPHLNDPEIARATSVNSAFAMVTRKAEEHATAALIAKRKARGALDGEIIKLLHGDARTLIKDVPAGSVDLLLVDPPYGVNADQPNFSRLQSGTKHTYSDKPTDARDFMQFLLIEGFRVAKDRANIFMFFDSKHLGWLYEAAARAAWSPFPTPLIWDKGSPGVAPWQDNGFARSYEMIFFATKGRRGTHTAIRDVLPHKRALDADKRHAAQKPDSLLRQLIALSTIPGEMVLDPCAGSGSTLLAARALQRRALGFELDKALYDGAMTSLFSKIGALE